MEHHIMDRPWLCYWDVKLWGCLWVVKWSLNLVWCITSWTLAFSFKISFWASLHLFTGMQFKLHKGNVRRERGYGYVGFLDFFGYIAPCKLLYIFYIRFKSKNMWHWMQKNGFQKQLLMGLFKLNVSSLSSVGGLKSKTYTKGNFKEKDNTASYLFIGSFKWKQS